MKKILLYLLMSVVLTLPKHQVFAESGILSAYVDLTDFKIGDSIVLYDSPLTGERIVVDVLPALNSKIATGSNPWSSGFIPESTVTLYPHYDDPLGYYTKMGFYITYDGLNQKILETYGEALTVEVGQISDVSSRIVTASPTASVSAKAQMNWVYTTGDDGASSSYLRIEINAENQMRLVWRY